MLLYFLPLVLQPVSAKESLEEYLQEEYRLLQTIFKNYSADLPATYTRGRSDSSVTPMIQNVNLTLMYINLLNIDEPAETIYFLLDVYMEWMDYRLKWNPANFSKIDVIMTGRSRVWTPDIVAYDIAQFDWGVPPERQQVVIFSNGTVALLTSINVGYNCELDITNLPFDVQHCSAKFSCYHSNDKELVLSPFYAPEFDEGVMNSNSWTAIGKSILLRTFEDKLHGWNYSEINFVFRLRRSATYYVVLIIIPSYILAFLCICGLFWSKITYSNYMEKLNLGYAGILAMVLILQMTTAEMVKTSSLPILCNHFLKFNCILALYSLMNLSSISVGSLAVLITGKAEGKLIKNRKFENNWPLRIIKRIHLIYLVFFLLIITINLIMLLLKKGEEEVQK